MADFINKNGLGGIIMWEFKGDMPYDSDQSLLKVASSKLKDKTIMGYWSDWSVYTAKAIPGEPYRVPGSIDPATQKQVTNADFTNKLDGMNILTYAFLEAKPTGEVYFFDPWSDLSAGGGMGNFEAFAKLQNTQGNLKKIMSIGGYGHDASFEDAFKTETAMNTFVSSTKNIIDKYKIDGVDLDYEDPNMTKEQSQQFAVLVAKLRSAMPDKLIHITILSSPEYILGQNGIGFDSTAFTSIVKNASHINLMTYDFHGAFDYAGGTGKTGFLTNLHMPKEISKDVAKFSIDTSVAAAIQAGAKPSQLSVGVPAYGRALANIPDTNDGLFQSMANAKNVPKGNLDEPSCIDDITHATCSGSFEYSYIVNNMLKQGFTEHERVQDGVSNGTTAYAETWQPKIAKAYKLSISNTGALGIMVSVDATGFGYTGPGQTNTFDGTTNPTTSKISDKTDLKIHWDTYQGGPKGDCPAKLSFDHDVTINIAVDNQGHGVCSVK